MTERANKLFSQLVDINWEISQHKAHNRKSDTFFEDLVSLEERYAEIETELKEDMGAPEYHRFVDMGKRMFASK